MKARTKVTAVLGLLVLCSIGRADELLVPTQYPTIQSAIDNANNGDTVLVADGVYTGEGNRDIDFFGKDITVRSENGPNNCIIDCNGTEAEPHRGFYFHSGEDADSVVDGFTITNGYIASTIRYGGGGVCCYYSSPTITNCTFSGNSVYGERYVYGGGMFNFDSSPTITNCTFSGNSAYGESYVYGGGMSNQERSNPTVTNCTFSGNSGGGMSNQMRSNPTVTNCIFSGNSRPNGNGGAIYCLDHSSPVITNCTFNGNSAINGGGIYCSFMCAPTIKDCIINNNSAVGDIWSGRGGGIYIRDSDSDIAIINSQINQNSAYSGGGIYCSTNSNLTIKGCTINNNLVEAEFDGYGGGIYSESNNLTITDSAICNNIARGEVSVGGGICSAAINNVTVKGCTINNNLADAEFAGRGGGIYSASNNLTITDSVICNNIARGDESEGGGICSLEDAKLIIANCVINGNIVEGNRLSNGGGILCRAASALIAGCTINNNAAKIVGTKSSYGGGIYFYKGSPIISKCKISGNLATYGCGIYCEQSSNTITGCIISGNSSPEKYIGRGVHCIGGSTAVNNCTIVGHSSEGIYCQNGAVTVTNSILYYNGYSLCGKPQISRPATVTYSDVQTYIYYEEPWPGIGNIKADPCFIESGHWDANHLWVEGDYHLLSISPCINTGDPNYVAEPNETDLDGLPRVIGGRIDMGAYEFNHQPVAEAGPNQVVYADHTGLAAVTLDGSDSYDEDGQGLTYKWTWTIDGNTFTASKSTDGIVNMLDFAAFAEQWPQSENPFADLLILAKAWLSTPASPDWNQQCDIAPVSPALTIELPVGEHTIELVVNDGFLDSEPDYVDVNVIAPLKAHLCIIPSVVNRSDHLRNIMAVIELPRGIKKADVMDEPFVLYPAGSEEGIEARWQYVYT